MKSILLAALMIMGSTAYSQSLMNNEIDKFTKKQKKETKWFYIKSSGIPAMASAYRNGDKLYLRLSISLNTPFGVLEGNPCLLLLDGKEDPIKLESAFTNSASYSSHWYCHLYYPIEEDKLTEILKYKITDIRITLSDGEYVDLKGIRPGKSEKIQSALSLVLKD